MNKLAASILTNIIILQLIIALSPAMALNETEVGVKEGDWIEYSINMSGPLLDQLRNLTWYRVDFLQVEGSMLTVNKTSQSVDGTYSSSMWHFDLAQGQLYGWVIIPANLSRGDSCFDATRNASITIEGEEQKNLLGTTRIITYASDPGKVYKEWDKETGVYVYSSDNTTDYAVTMKAAATNMWHLKTAKQDNFQYYQLEVLILSVLVLSAVSVILFMRKRRKNLLLSAISILCYTRELLSLKSK
jgi:hypothetical protein